MDRPYLTKLILLVLFKLALPYLAMGLAFLVMFKLSLPMLAIIPVIGISVAVIIIIHTLWKMK